MDSPDYVATVRIFDVEGRLTNTLINNELLGMKGIIQWQGLTEENTKARMGIYILHVQLFRPDGTVEAIQKTCVLAGY